jgi:hypothetical protein
MLRISQVIKPWKESGALNAHINLYGFWNDEVSSPKGSIACSRWRSSMQVVIEGVRDDGDASRHFFYKKITAA